MISPPPPVGNGVGFLAALPVVDAHGIFVLLYAEAGFALLVTLLCVADHACFPAQPPSFPSASAAAVRAVDTLPDFKHLVTNWNFMILAAVYGVSQGTYSGWGGVLAPILEPLNYRCAYCAVLALTARSCPPPCLCVCLCDGWLIASQHTLVHRFRLPLAHYSYSTLELQVCVLGSCTLTPA